MSKKDEHLILQGHVPKGTKFIPKLLTLSTEFHSVSYIRFMVPELLWLAVINHHLGTQRVIRFIEVIANACKRNVPEEEVWFAAASCLGAFTNESKIAVVHSLETHGIRTEITEALAPFVNLYPEFPGAFLLENNVKTISPNYLFDFKQLLERLYDTESIDAVFMCANAVYIALCLELLIVGADTSLARFTEVQYYPETEISKDIAAGCRALALQMVGEHVHQATWTSYFWNQGLKIEPIDWNS